MKAPTGLGTSRGDTELFNAGFFSSTLHSRTSRTLFESFTARERLWATTRGERRRLRAAADHHRGFLSVCRGAAFLGSAVAAPPSPSLYLSTVARKTASETYFGQGGQKKVGWSCQTGRRHSGRGVALPRGSVAHSIAYTPTAWPLPAFSAEKVAQNVRDRDTRGTRTKCGRRTPPPFIPTYPCSSPP